MVGFYLSLLWRTRLEWEQGRFVKPSRKQRCIWTSAEGTSVSFESYPHQKRLLISYTDHFWSTASCLIEFNPMYHKGSNERAYASPLLKAKNQIKEEMNTIWYYSHADWYELCCSMKCSEGENRHWLFLSFFFFFPRKYVDVKQYRASL